MIYDRSFEGVKDGGISGIEERKGKEQKRLGGNVEIEVCGSRTATKACSRQRVGQELRSIEHL